jgi:sugar phosphate isomerase/epimerase
MENAAGEATDENGLGTREQAKDLATSPHDGLPPVPHPLHARLGLGVPNEWWPSGPLLKSFEAAGFALTQLPSPPRSVLSDARYLSRHAAAARAAVDTTGLAPILHAPRGVLAGTPSDDHAMEGLLAYAAEIGAAQVVYHAHALPDRASSEDRLLAETRSLARLAARAERLGVTIAIENLAPTFPGPERLADTPLVLRALAHRVGSPRVGLCLDIGHAHIVAGLKHAALEHLVKPVLDSVVLFHVHDNLGARWDRTAPAGLDPLRLDLHLPPGRGTLPWADVAPLMLAHDAPLLLEVHPPNRPRPDELFSDTRDLLSGAAPAGHQLAGLAP